MDSFSLQEKVFNAASQALRKSNEGFLHYATVRHEISTDGQQLQVKIYSSGFTTTTSPAATTINPSARLKFGKLVNNVVAKVFSPQLFRAYDSPTPPTVREILFELFDYTTPFGKEAPFVSVCIYLPYFSK